MVDLRRGEDERGTCRVGKNGSIRRKIMYKSEMGPCLTLNNDMSSSSSSTLAVGSSAGVKSVVS